MDFLGGVPLRVRAWLGCLHVEGSFCVSRGSRDCKQTKERKRKKGELHRDLVALTSDLADLVHNLCLVTTSTSWHMSSVACNCPLHPVPASPLSSAKPLRPRHLLGLQSPPSCLRPVPMWPSRTCCSIVVHFFPLPGSPQHLLDPGISSSLLHSKVRKHPSSASPSPTRRLPSLPETVTEVTAEIFTVPAATPCLTDQFSMETLLCSSVGPPGTADHLGRPLARSSGHCATYTDGLPSPSSGHQAGFSLPAPHCDLASSHSASSLQP